MSDEAKVKILTEEDLININGGTDSKQTSGMPCPSCHAFIPISIYQIITGSSIFCPACALRLDIDKSQREKTLEILKGIH